MKRAGRNKLTEGSGGKDVEPARPGFRSLHYLLYSESS